MGKLRKNNPRKITLEDFVGVYVDVALKLAESNLFLDDFDYKVWWRISEETPLSFEAVKYLHHPFHSAFFNDKGSGSPLILLKPKKRWQSSSVHLDKNLLFGQQRFAEYIMERNSDYLRERWNILTEDNFITPSQLPENENRRYPVLLNEFSSGIVDHCKKENKRINIFGGSILDRYILLCAIKFKHFKLSVHINKELHGRYEEDYTIDLNVMKIKYR